MADLITSSPSGVPANYSDPSITRAGLISGLNIINVHAYDKFHETYGFVPYASLAQILGHEEQVAENKEFKWYQSRGRALGFVVAVGAVAVAAGAPATITVTSAGHTQSGTKSLPAVGMIFRNARTGVQSRVSAVNKSVASAHTFTLTPVVAAQNASVSALDELLCEGFKYLGESSDKTDTIIRNVDKYSNFCTEIRADDTIGDLASAERMEFQINGSYAYVTKQQRDTDLRLMRELDLLIMEGTQTDNLPYVEEGSNGLIKQVQANGVNGTYTAWSLATYATMERALSAVGAPKEYDVLSDNAAMIEMQNSIFTEIGGGAIVYADAAGARGGIDLNRDFQSLKIYGRKYNFTNYGLFDEQTNFGSAGLGLRNRFSLFLATGNTSAVSASGSTVTKPRFTVMNQRPFGCNKWHTKENGLFSDGGGTKAEKINTTIGYFGSRLIGAQQCMIMKGA